MNPNNAYLASLLNKLYLNTDEHLFKITNVEVLNNYIRLNIEAELNRGTNRSGLELTHDPDGEKIWFALWNRDDKYEKPDFYEAQLIAQRLNGNFADLYWSSSDYMTQILSRVELDIEGEVRNSYSSKADIEFIYDFGKCDLLTAADIINQWELDYADE